MNAVGYFGVVSECSTNASKLVVAALAGFSRRPASQRMRHELAKKLNAKFEEREKSMDGPADISGCDNRHKGAFSECARG